MTTTPETTTTRQPASDPSPIKRARIILVESSNDIGVMISTVIAEETDYDIDWVLDAEGFRRAMNTDGFWPPDLMLLDVNELDGDYKDLLKYAVSQGNNSPPIIVISGWSPAKMQRVVEQVHLGDTIVKPFDLDTLLNSIQHVLENRKESKSIAQERSSSAVRNLPISVQSTSNIAHI